MRSSSPHGRGSPHSCVGSFFALSTLPVLLALNAALVNAGETMERASADLLSGCGGEKRFYLYDLPRGEISNDLFSPAAYGIEWYRALMDHPLRTNDPNKAFIFFTCISDECNYPNYDMTCPKRRVGTDKIAKEVQGLLHYGKGTHVVHFHNGPDFRARVQDKSIVNVAYFDTGRDEIAANDPEEARRVVVITPPAIKSPRFRANPFGEPTDRDLKLVFKGTLERTKVVGGKEVEVRKDVVDMVNEFSHVDGILILGHDYFHNKEEGGSDKRNYVYLLENSVFALNMEGDLPWAYRLSEIISSGAIPLIVRDEWRPMPFEDVVDYDDFSVVIDKSNTSGLRSVLEDIAAGKGVAAPAEVARRFRRLRFVWRHYFRSVRAHAEYVLRCLTRDAPSETGP